MTNATMREGSIYHDAYDGFDDIEQQKIVSDEMMQQIGPKLVYETADQRKQRLSQGRLI